VHRFSLHAGDGEFWRVIPKTGSCVAVQVLVRFDMEQVSVLFSSPISSPFFSPYPLLNAD
jgi:hypothetical protein